MEAGAVPVVAGAEADLEAGVVDLAAVLAAVAASAAAAPAAAGSRKRILTVLF